ncbi:ribosomal protein S18 [Hypoxylon sp. NC1633]|nr:ribosomal protein S18 [Hypoxylon sp. NC1633]
MPPRIPILAALRHPSTLFRSQTASISTTRPSQAVRKDVPTVTSALLDIDSSSSSSPSPSSPSAVPRSPTEIAANRYEQLGARREGQRGAQREGLERRLKELNHSDDYARQMTRRWSIGDVYAPHDLSPQEMAKWRRNQARKKDLVDLLGLRPLDMYRNFSVISEFMTPHGRIKRAVETGLRPPNQRKMAKAIRRAIGIGIHPSVHHHPELLMRQKSRMYVQNMASLKNGK